MAQWRETGDGTFSTTPSTTLFPQPSTTKHPAPVTNNLYSESQNEQARYMREGFPKEFSTTTRLTRSQSVAKSLLRNILAVTPCGFNILPEPSPSLPTQVVKNEYLRRTEEKICGDQVEIDQIRRQPVANLSTIVIDDRVSP